MDAPRNFYNIFPATCAAFWQLGNIARVYIKKKEKRKGGGERGEVLFIDVKYLSKQRNSLFIYE